MPPRQSRAKVVTCSQAWVHWSAASLVQRVDGVGDEPRFTMLETIREFALDRLEASTENAIIRKPMRRYLDLAERTAGKFRYYAEMRLVWAAWLQTEHDNLRLALSWLAESPDLTPVCA